MGTNKKNIDLAFTRETGTDILDGDVVEVAPPFDRSQFTALAATTVTMNIIALFPNRKQANHGASC